MALTIQERLKDLRVERGLTLEQLAEQTHLSKSALGSYEADEYKDISHYALIELAKFYEVTVDYLLGRSQTKNHPNADLADLRLSDDMIELLKSGRVDNSLLCELATHPDFPRLMADLEIYVNGVAGKQVQSANAIVDAVSATIMKQHNPGLTDPQLRQLMQYQEGLIKLVSLKTRNARRTVYMSDKLKAYLRHLERENKAQAAALAAQRAQNQTFITDIDGKQISSLELVNTLPNGKIQTVNSMKYHSKTIKAKLGINFKFHYLRHTYGTRLAEMNTPTHILCNQMGHASGKVTERYYLAVSKPGIEVLTHNLNAM